MKKENSSHYKRSKKLKALRFGQYTLNAIGIIVLCYGVYEAACLFLNYKRCETSNDAQIEQYISPINIRVPGYVKKVYFTEHQFVHKGDTLLVLDDREYTSIGSRGGFERCRKRNCNLIFQFDDDTGDCFGLRCLYRGNKYTHKQIAKRLDSLP